MLQFECPSCKTQWQADDQYAGKLVVCPKCQTTATVRAPSDGSGATAVTTPDVAEAAQKAKSKWQDDDRRRDTLSIAKDGGAPASWLRIGVYSVIGLIVCLVVVALVVPATSKVREAAART